MFKVLAILVCSIIILLLPNPSSGQDIGFTYDGFRSANLSLDGATNVTQNGLLRLTNYESLNQIGHTFYPDPITFKDSVNGSVSSFSTTFVFGIIPQEADSDGGNGMTFVIAPQRGLPGALPSQYLGLFNISNMNSTSNRVFAVELDTLQNAEFHDINNNHVGIDINGLISIEAESAGYHDPSGFKNLTLISGRRMQVWVEYDGVEKQINVTLAPFEVPKPSTPLISISYDLSEVVNENSYVGFSAGTGTILASFYVVGWSFKMNGQAQALNLTKLPELPGLPSVQKHDTSNNLVSIGIPIMSTGFVLVLVSGVVYYVLRRRRYAEVLEDWELEYGPHRFKFKDLYKATKGFSEQEVVGTGGFGKVYKGVLPKSMTEIAVKRVSHDARQGMQEFVAEIVSIGRLRHRNLVSLLGYCRRKGELLLVYDYMTYGSLDKYLYNNPKVTLSWTQRFRVIKGVAAGLVYLHEDWEQVVIHRDIKAGNVLIDAEQNGRLGDFGLARLYDHGAETRTTNIIGTLGYLAPELMRNGRATKSTDVFAFGAFLLEVASGRRPIEIEGQENDILVDWVLACANSGEILEARDPNLGDEFVSGEIELVLRLGLMCSSADPELRPSMRQVVQYLERETPLPMLSAMGMPSSGLPFASRQRTTSNPSSADTMFLNSSSGSVSDSYLSIGR